MEKGSNYVKQDFSPYAFGHSYYTDCFFSGAFYQVLVQLQQYSGFGYGAGSALYSAKYNYNPDCVCCRKNVQKCVATRQLQ